ncbi:hypothetical protein R3P38DRAFT_1658425 [Favolaschia claudopus]|uniref:Transmembrane protein n=1 Tax=Favolaschia claudopus TaxID=2862362 RepID=A0AAW0AE67_9AGAR
MFRKSEPPTSAAQASSSYPPGYRGSHIHSSGEEAGEENLSLCSPKLSECVHKRWVLTLRMYGLSLLSFFGSLRTFFLPRWLLAHSQSIPVPYQLVSFHFPFRFRWLICVAGLSLFFGVNGVWIQHRCRDSGFMKLAFFCVHSPRRIFDVLICPRSFIPAAAGK